MRLPQRNSSYELAVFRSGLLFGFGIGTIVGFLLATGLAALALS